MAVRRKPAFTLIELLVVIAVIAILAALLFPLFARARERSRAATCASNLRQLAMAIHQYMQDWEGGLPEFYAWGRTPEQFLSFRWYSHIMPYLRNQAILHCPSDTIDSGRRAVPFWFPRSWVDYPGIPHLSYGFNYWIQQTQETTVTLPADTVLVADASAHQCGEARRMIGGLDASCYAYANGIQATDGRSPFTGSPGQERHSGGSNVAFFDGHVRFIPAGQFRKQRQGRACYEYPLVEITCSPWQ
jgi:prepilin-type N-terminal cleavage/methylation domain-containing protein/prepilin-type processing-associated H-X9-DG protein